MYVFLARATIPAALLGSDQIGDLLGRLARPTVIARAVAPWCFAAASAHVGTTSAVASLVIGALASVAVYSMALRSAASPPAWRPLPHGDPAPAAR